MSEAQRSEEDRCHHDFYYGECFLCGSIAGVDFGNMTDVARATRALVKSWKAAYIAMRKASKLRAAVGPHATRARLTTANARYARAAEDFDRKDAALREWAATVDPIDVDALRAEMTT